MRSVRTVKPRLARLSISLRGEFRRLGGEAVQFGAEVFVPEPPVEGGLTDAGLQGSLPPFRGRPPGWEGRESGAVRAVGAQGPFYPVLMCVAQCGRMIHARESYLVKSA